MAKKIEKKEGVPCGQVVFTAMALTFILIVSLLLALYIANHIHLIYAVELAWENIYASI